MNFQTSLILLMNIGLLQAISFCCNGTNEIKSDPSSPSVKKCTNGILPKELDCQDKFIMQKNDNISTFLYDDLHNLIVDDEIVPPNKYCFTVLQPKNIEVYIMCADEDDFDTMARQINIILSLISVFFIVLTVFVYVLVPEILELQEICLLHSITGLAFGYVGLAIINLSGHLPEGACHFFAYFMYFAFMYSFFWLNILCFHIWKHVVHIDILEKIKNWKTIYHVYGIGAPILALCWLMFLNHTKLDGLKHIYPGIGYSICWFPTIKETTIFFYGPISVLLFLNVIFFVNTGIILWQQSRNCPKTKALKYRLKLYVKLFFIMGVAWIFEVISNFYDDTTRWIWIVTDIINALQGFIIFLILVVFRKKIKRSLANRKVCGYRFPLYWKNDKDSECEELEEAEYSLENNSPTKLNF